MSRNAFGRTLETELRVAEANRQADALVGTEPDSYTRGRILVAAGFGVGLLMGQHKADVMGYRERCKELYVAGKCREACELVTLYGGYTVCRHTDEPCDRERLKALAAAWGVVNQGGEESGVCLMPGLD